MTTVLENLVSSLANPWCEEIADRVISHLKAQRAALSGDDSGLHNAWEELCVQVRAGESFYWELYESTSLGLVTWELSQLDIAQQRAIWLQTDAGWDWLWDVEHEGEVEESNRAVPPIPFDNSESAQYIYANYLLRRAEDDSNASVDAYIERDQSGRAELDRGAGQVE